mmetsp:Transcript_25797/g.35940  ORF Transcript_25797/g.35940 Transcript_25797/m.35940 type:complete len:355 (-) Transcript_25797:169-1233(-)
MAEAGVVVSDKLSPDAQQFISKPKRCGSPTESSSSNCSTSSSITSQEIENFGGQRFPHLRLVDLLSTNKDEQGMEFNSVKGIPFQSKLFKGKAIFKLRPKSTSILSGPYVDYFERYQRFFSLQIQGKFLLSSEELKNKMIWIGAEIGHVSPERKHENKMSLGFMQKALCSLVLRAINIMRGDCIHYSFGDNGQLPHIMLPLYAAADTFIQTKTDTSQAGKKTELPTMGVRMFPQDEINLKHRRKYALKKPHNFQGGSDAAYSFSLHNGNLDLYSWKVSGIPGLQPMDLTSYWSDMPLRIVGYMVRKHRHEKKNTSQNSFLIFRRKERIHQTLSSILLRRSNTSSAFFFLIWKLS